MLKCSPRNTPLYIRWYMGLIIFTKYTYLVFSLHVWVECFFLQLEVEVVGLLKVPSQGAPTIFPMNFRRKPPGYPTAALQLAASQWQKASRSFGRGANTTSPVCLEMMVVPNNQGFPTKNDHFRVLWGYHHLRKRPKNGLIHNHTTSREGSHIPPFWKGKSSTQRCRLRWIWYISSQEGVIF